MKRSSHRAKDSDNPEKYRATCTRWLNGHGPSTAAEILSSIPTDLGADRYGAGGAVEALEKEIILDCAIAKNETEGKRMWEMRENMTESQVHEGRNIKHDVSIPISRMADFITAADAALVKVYPGVRPISFGHVGDGNLHYNIAHPLDKFTEESWMHEWEKINLIVHDIVATFNGSISAEHGIGQLKREEIKRYKAPLELAVMRSIKAALDPQNIMNPGKVL